MLLRAFQMTLTNLTLNTLCFSRFCGLPPPLTPLLEAVPPKSNLVTTFKEFLHLFLVIFPSVLEVPAIETHCISFSLLD